MQSFSNQKCFLTLGRISYYYQRGSSRYFLDIGFNISPIKIIVDSQELFASTLGVGILLFTENYLFSMHSDFIEQLRRVSLTVEEDEVIMVRSAHYEKTLEDCSFSLLGRFHMTKLINFRAAKNHLRSIWKMGNDLKITDVGGRLFRFKFPMESQLKWVINNGSWSFDNHILLLRRWEKGMMAFRLSS